MKIYGMKPVLLSFFMLQVLCWPVQSGDSAVLGADAVVGELAFDAEYIRRNIGLVDIPALKLTTEHLLKTHSNEYPNGRRFLDKLSLFENDFPSIREGVVAGREESLNRATQLLKLQRRILLENPSIDFDSILLIRRRVRGNLGLPQNWEGNSSLARHGWDNEIASMSIRDHSAPFQTVYQPSNGAFVGDLDLHFDADTIMFSMPGSNQRWQLHEIGLDGQDLRQLPLIPDGDVDNYDACYLPDGNIIFTSTAPFVGVPCVQGVSHVANLYLFDRQRESIRRLTFDQDHNWCPTVMPSGQVMYLRWEYTDIPHMVSRILFTMNPDGTNQRGYYGSNSYWPNSIFYARPIPEHPTKFVGIVTGHHGVPRMGELVLFDSALGRFEADGVLQRIPGHGKKVEPIIEDYLVDRSWPKFLHPYPLSGEYFLVSAKLTPESNWGIYLVDIFDNMLLLREEPGHVLFEPIPLKTRVRPPVIPSRVDETSATAKMYITDIYAGEGLQDVPRGTVRGLRLFAYQFAYHGMGGQVNRVGLDGPWDVKRVLGTVPVERDGSAMFNVPANTPISIQPLDEDGKAIALMRSWATAMPGEILSCIGCHESHGMTPPAEIRLASQKPASDIQPWHGPVRGFSFEREVQPVLDKYCITCHSGGDNSIAVPDLTAREPVEVDVGLGAYRAGSRFSPSYLAIRRFVRAPTIESDMHLLPPYEFHANTAELIQMLEKGHHNVKLSEEARSRFYTWIDLGSPYHGSWTEMLGSGRVAHQRRRRLELMKRYTTRSDDEENIAAAPQTPVEMVTPEKFVPSEDPLSQVEWGFSREEAQGRQEETAMVRKTIALGEGVSMELVAIPAGSFAMGDVDGHEDERPLRMREIDKPFWMGKYEVTNEQFSLFDSAHKSGIEHGDYLQFSERERGYDLGSARQPVARVTYDQAVAFCEWLSKKTGKKVSLPTETQWEWSCRAGTQTQHWFGADGNDFAKYANLADSTFERVETLGFELPSGAVPVWRPAISSQDDGFRVSALVGSYEPNPWGLYDMHGNVSEWTRSIYTGSLGADAAIYDPSSRQRRVVRGGSWYNRPQRATSSWRWGYHPWQRVYDVGFRVVIEE